MNPLTCEWWLDEETSHCSMSRFYFFVKCSIPERINAIGVKQWQMSIKNNAERASSIDELKLASRHDNIHCMLARLELKCQQLKDATFFLELALWKSNIDQLDDDIAENARGQCRINCGADIIIPNSLPYLITNVEEVKNDGNDLTSEEEGEIQVTRKKIPVMKIACLPYNSSDGEEDSDEESDSGDEDMMRV